MLDLGRPRTIQEMLREAARLYARQPLLLLFLAGIVLVPYQLAVLLIVNGKGGASVGTVLLLLLVNLALIGPCIAALQVQVVVALGSGEPPRLGNVLRQGLSVLPVVAAAEIIAGIAIAFGLICFLIPGLIISVRLAVVAQAAAVERTDWPGALRRSVELTFRNAWRVLGLVVINGLLIQIPAQITGSGNRPVAAVVGIALAVIVQVFVTLTVNLLYFDLRARQTAVPVA